jgi:hypothetical protein
MIPPHWMGGLRSDPGAFFAGAVRNLAEAEGLEFPACVHAKAVSASAARLGTGPRAHPPPPAFAGDDEPLLPEDARKYIVQILANLSSESGAGT